MKRKGGSEDKQRTISSFFSASAPRKVAKPLVERQPAAPHGQHAGHHNTTPPSPKRHKGNPEPDCIIIDGSHSDGAAPAAGSHQIAVQAPPAPVALAPIPTSRNKSRHSKAQAKLVGAADATSLAEPGSGQTHASAAAGSTSTRPSSSGRHQQPNYTPLEKQIVKLKKDNPGVLLAVEVGYKFRFFGEDAQIAAQELGVYCYPDHNFLTASFPVQRLPIHVRRLVSAGHKVGVVRQLESAALKAVSDNKSAPFTRELTGLFTAATLDAGEKADKIGEASAIEASQELESMLGAGSTAAAANYLLVIAEQQQQQQQEELSQSSSSGILGVLAVDVGSGDIAYGLCSSSSSSAITGSSSSESGSSLVTPLEAVLLSFSPADIVVVEPVSAATNRLLSSYVAGSSRKCRIERQQQQQTSSSSSSSQGYLDSDTLQHLQEFYSGSSAAAAAAAGEAAAGSSSSSSQDDLHFILSLPHIVLRALRGALTYLNAFGLTRVLKCTSGFRPLGVGQQMKLDGNALRQLQILQTGVDVSSASRGVQGSLLHLLDRCSTAAGSRLLRRWLSAPLADRQMILDRQEAVQALLSASEGNTTISTAAVAGSSALLLLSGVGSWLQQQRHDLERILSRVTAGTAAPAEAVGLWKTLAQLPKSLKLPLNPDTHQLDLNALAAAVPSRLLLTLLAAAAGSSAVAAASEVLGWLDAGAALKNDYLAVFKSKDRFPEVHSRAAAVSAAESHLKGLLPQLAAAAGVPSLSYVSVANQGNWMVELPATRTDIPQGWQKVCGTKKVNRFHSPEVKLGIAALARAQEQQQATAAATWQTLLQQFTDKHYATCREAVSAIAELDALHALSEVAATPGYTRPEFISNDDPQQLIIKDGKHPMLDLALDGGAVSNSLELKWDGVRAAVITGPNMGGKSVLIRQAGVILIMAQLGSWVPAAACRLSVFDGVFSRQGASDSLMMGRSTFAEELEDASHILQTATNRSLVIIDELGRGTATHDGVAIATATLQHLVTVKHCLTLFVTHYPEVAALAEPSSSSSSSSDRIAGTFQQLDGSGAVQHPHAAAAAAGSSPSTHIAVYHMSYIRQDPAPATAAAAASSSAANAASTATAAGSSIPVITFLYKLTPGAADASFGLNVAQMAGLPPSVVQRAAAIAAQLKDKVDQQQQHQESCDTAAAVSDSEALLQCLRRFVAGLRALKSLDEAAAVSKAGGDEVGQQQQQQQRSGSDVAEPSNHIGARLCQMQQFVGEALSTISSAASIQ